MFVLSRKAGERLMIGPNIVLTVWRSDAGPSNRRAKRP